MTGSCSNELHLDLNLFVINASVFKLSALHSVMFCYMLYEFFFDLLFLTLVLVMRLSQFLIIVDILYLEIFR